MIKMLSRNNRIYIFFPDFSCMPICTYAYTHATFLVVEIADGFLGQALYG